MTNELKGQKRLSAFEFVSRIIASLAWPLTVLVTGYFLRKPLTSAISGPLRRLKAGPSGLEMEWDERVERTKEELIWSPELASAALPARAPLVSEELRPLAEVSPSIAVMEGLATVERELRTKVAGTEAGTDQMSVVGLARRAQQLGSISDETLNAIKGLAVLRNLAAHGQSGEVTLERAVDYLSLVDAVLFALRGQGHKN